MTVDKSSVAFADYYMATSSRPVSPSKTPLAQQQPRKYGNVSYTITAEEATRDVGDLFVLMTNPADGRYSPLLGANQGGDQAELRALLLPVVVDTADGVQDAEVRSCSTHLPVPGVRAGDICRQFAGSASISLCFHSPHAAMCCM